MSGPIPGACAVVLALLSLLALVLTVRDHLRARRNERQLQNHIRLRNGLKTARRMGWLPEDLQ